MAITSIGYDGSVNEAQWSKLVPLAGSSHYGVGAGPDWKVTPHATLDRGISIAPGSGWGHGVLDTSDATVSLQGTTVSSGSRYDMVVARRNWGGAGGLTTFVLIPGSANFGLPARNTNPGTLDDQPIALVKFTAGQTAPTAVVDLRCFARNGGMTAQHDLALTYLGQPGTQVMINGTQYNCTLDANGSPSWTMFVSGRIPLFGAASALDNPAGTTPRSLIDGGQQFLIQTGTTVQTSDPSGYARITWPKPFPNGLLYCSGFNGDDYALQMGGLVIASSGGGQIFGSESFGNKTSWVYVLHGYSTGYNDGPLIRKGNTLHRINWLAIGW